MDFADKRKSIKSYFDGGSILLALLLIGLGIPAIAFMGLGLIMIGWGLFLLWRRRKLMSDEQIDRWIEEDFAAHNFVERAWRLAGSPNLERHPTFIRGFADEELEKRVFSGERWGEDGVWRKTPLAATVILCTQDQIIVYQTGLDLTTGNRVNERVVEAFYQDVISVSIASRSETIDLDAMSKSIKSAKFDLKDVRQGLSRRKMRKILTRMKTKYRNHIVGDILQLEQSKVYSIELSDGDTITIQVPDGRPTSVAGTLDDAAQGDVNAQNMVALRSFVREKKQRLLHRYGSIASGPLV